MQLQKTTGSLRLASNANLLTLSPSCAANMASAFRSLKAMHRALSTNPVTWKQITVGEGARPATVKSIAMNFIQILHDLHKADFANNDANFYPLIAKRIYEDHAAMIERGDWEAMIRSP